MPSEPTVVSVDTLFNPSRASDSCARACNRLKRMTPAIAGSRVSIRFSATDSVGIKLSSCWTISTPDVSASRFVIG